MVEMLVSLKIPDATALSALQALHEMGYKQLKSLERSIYYQFQISGDEKKFRESIAKADILVNSNKHTASFEISKDPKRVFILVEDIEQGTVLLRNLKDRLGFSVIKSTNTGTLWAFTIDSKEKKELAKKMVEDLLSNIHYQKYSVVK